MTTTVTYSITFHGPFRVATGNPSEGFDSTVGADPLPSSSLKGLMRTSAEQLASIAAAPNLALLVEEVFGVRGDAGAWAWTSASFDSPVSVESRSRIAIDPVTHTVEKGALMRAQHHEAESARFHVTQIEALADHDLNNHQKLLSAAALGTHSLGGDRNRGFGWVTIRPDTNETTASFDPGTLAEWLLTTTEETGR